MIQPSHLTPTWDETLDLKEHCHEHDQNLVAATLSALSGYAYAAETVKPLQGVTCHTATKDAGAYYLADKGTC